MEYNILNYCPLTEQNEDIVDCMENMDVKEEFIPARFKAKSNWKKICEDCPIHKRLMAE